MKYQINDENLVKIRLDKYLTSVLDLSRSNIQNLLIEGKILVNDKKVKSNYLLKMNDVIEIKSKEKDKNNSISLEKIDLDIVYEDEDLIVVNKPSGLVVHPAVGNQSGTLVNALLYHTNNLSSINGEVRPGIVHRIDADTSGLLVVAKNDKAHISLAKQISEKTVTRKYIALVQGVIKEDTATIDAPIGRDKNDRKKMCVTLDNSKDAITHIKVLERYKTTTLIECKLETGRTHQIRVHMKYINHPVVNDPVYGYKNLDDKEFGQMLHAYIIGFIHPRTGKYLEFKVDPPKKFMEILKKYQEI